MKRLIFIFLLLSSPLYSQTPSLEMLSPVFGGSGSYSSPWVLKKAAVKFKVYCSSNDNGTTTYRVSVHASIGRACCVMYQWGDYDYSTTHKSEHNVTNLSTGTFYVKVDWIQSGKKQKPDKFWITCQVPPVDSYSAPYTPPPNASAPTIVVTPSNVKNSNAAGTQSDPFIPTSTTLYFSLANSIGMTNGCWWYAIVISNTGLLGHPHYNNGHDCSNVDEVLERTASFYSDLSTAQTYNTVTQVGTPGDIGGVAHATSKNGLYHLDCYFFNRHGMRSTSRTTWYIAAHDEDNDEPQPDPPPVPDVTDTTACPVPTGLEVFEP